MLHHLKQLFIVSDMDLYFKAMLEFEAVSSQYPQDVEQLSLLNLFDLLKQAAAPFVQHL